MRKPSKKALIQRIEDIVAGCYGDRFNEEMYLQIMHMGSMEDFGRFIAVVNNAFPMESGPSQKEWSIPTMPWNLDEWGTPEKLAELLLRHWEEKK